MARKSDTAIYMQNAMKLVSEALQLDNENKTKEAYTQYLYSVQYITQILLQDVVNQEVTVSGSTVKLSRLNQQCVDRVADLVAMLPKQSDESAAVSSLVHETMPPEDLAALEPPDLIPIVPRVKQPGPLELAQRQNQQLMSAYRARMSRGKDVSNQQAANLSLTIQRRMAENMAIAQAREQALQKKLQERHRRLQEEAARRFASSTGMYKDEQERRQLYTLVLEYEHDLEGWSSLRKKLKQQPENFELMQNLVKQILRTTDHPLTQLISKYQRQTYDKLQPLLQEHHQSLKSLSLSWRSSSYTASCSEAGSSLSLDRSISHQSTTSNTSQLPPHPLQSPSSPCSDVHTSIGHSLTSPLTEYDIDEFDDLFDDDDDDGDDKKGDIFISVPHKSESGAGDSEHLGPQIDSKKDEPLTDSCKKKNIEDSIKGLEQEALERHVQNISQDVLDYLEKILTMFVVAYEQLDNPEGRDLCYACVEEPFFRPIWKHLLALFRLANKDNEDKLQAVMSRRADSSPQDFGVASKFQLTSSVVPTTYRFPYEAAVVELCHLPDYFSPLNKLECIVKVSKLICKCVEEYYTNQGKSLPGIGADDLLPIMSYVVLKSGVAQLISECRALQEFIHEGYLMGEEGYCLTSLQTVLGYLTTLTNETEAFQTSLSEVNS